VGVTSDLDLRERRELSDLFLEVGPDAPTLSGAWTTLDLAAHLVVRERDLRGAPGILVPALEGLTERRMAAQIDRHGYEGLVELVRSGPPFGPMRIPPVRHAANLVEFFVHHEDVRRPAGYEARSDRPDLDAELWGFLARMAPLMLRKAKVRDVALELVTPAGERRRVGSGETVSITGPVGELVLELYGRREVAQVAYDGPADAVATVQGASFGI
jgi:uncharacterized protein (TIGR03085 family)